LLSSSLSHRAIAAEDRFVPNPDRTAQLADALQATLGDVTFPVDRSIAVTLRVLIAEYVAALRAVGVTPEGSVVAVKRVLTDAGFHRKVNSESTGRALTSEAQLLDDVVAWSIREYYSSSGS
jgi:hypothetical protein